MDKNHEITLEQEIAKELGWEVMANFRRLEDNLEENLVLKKIYEKIGKELKKQIMSIVTDSTPLEEPKNPDNNITKLYSLFATEAETEELKQKFLAGNFGYGHAKTELLDKFMDYFAPFREKREELVNNMDYVYEILQKGAEKARSIATVKMDEVRSVVGLLDKNY